jgi:putative hydrolase of the HAD superfamily
MSRPAILFDLDDTLVSERPYAEAAVLDTCRPVAEAHGIEPSALAAAVFECAREIWYTCPVRQFCVDCGISSWEGLWGTYDAASADSRTLTEWVRHYRPRAWTAALKRFKIDPHPHAPRMAVAFVDHRKRYTAPYPDAQPTLRILRPHYRLAVLTNGAPIVQRWKLAATGLADWFDTVVVAGDIGACKPDPRLFDHALRCLNAQPQHTTMIGDSLDRDIAGAKAAGLHTVWLNRTAKTNDSHIRPHATITTLADLPALLS